MIAAPPMHQQFSLSGSSHYVPVHASPLSPLRSSSSASSSSHSESQSQSQSQFRFQSHPSTPNTQSTTTYQTQAGTQTHTQSQTEFQTNTATSTRSKTSPSFAQRYATTISNPLSRTLTTPTARRTLFLNRVRRDRHDGRFETRGEQLALMEHVAEERKWDASMKRHADGIFEGYLRDLETSEFEPEFESGDGSEIGDVAALDEYLAQEHAEMDLFTSGPSSGPDGSFSDEEYDHIFMDLVHSTQDMDMSG
ncbi:hypothetical protein EYZ11_001504 [Aspergillus tanneri]|uniref:Uncharacterized protein n=1 Tax=Aspergillus tanneri TaxID=1220188 RepID=A0A4V3UQG2_9EURO|nr:hypothetical protein EYZ11_001504 [Aspergillus tanneri]